MKILFISDIHGININLKKIEKIIEKEGIDKLVVLGDLYYAGPTYNQKYEVNSMNVKDTLTKYSDKIICLKVVKISIKVIFIDLSLLFYLIQQYIQFEIYHHLLYM